MHIKTYDEVRIFYFTKNIPKKTARKPIIKLAIVYKAKFVKSPDFKSTWFS